MTFLVIESAVTKEEMISDEESDNDSNSTSVSSSERPKYRPRVSSLSASKQNHYGSFYLRMGAVGKFLFKFHKQCTLPKKVNELICFLAFGIGSMIYSGLEFGQYFELERNTKCHNVLLALTPATRMAFIFIQMYFIFLNNEVS